MKTQNSYEVNRYNVPVGLPRIRKVFPTGGFKYVRTIDPSDLDSKTKTCLVSISEYGHNSNRISRCWYTFDGSTPRPTNGHRMTSRSILQLSVDMIKNIKFSNEPPHQSGDFRLFVDQLTS